MVIETSRLLTLLLPVDNLHCYCLPLKGTDNHIDVRDVVQVQDDNLPRGTKNRKVHFSSIGEVTSKYSSFCMLLSSTFFALLYLLQRISMKGTVHGSLAFCTRK